MTKVAITGGIGSGKSFVCRHLQQQGITVYDCDAAAKRLMRTSRQLQQQLTQLIGPEAFLPAAAEPPVVNKAVVARFLLASEENARALDALVHPAVAADFMRSGAQWMECAILYESGFQRLVDRVVVVTAPVDVRLQRIMSRDGISRDKAIQWMERQYPQEEVRQRADFEIVNDGRQPLLPQIERIIQELHL